MNSVETVEGADLFPSVPLRRGPNWHSITTARLPNKETDLIIYNVQKECYKISKYFDDLVLLQVSMFTEAKQEQKMEARRNK